MKKIVIVEPGEKYEAKENELVIIAPKKEMGLFMTAKGRVLSRYQLVEAIYDM